MKTELVLIGKTSESYLEHGICDYIGRIKHYFPFDVTVIPAIKNAKSISQSLQKQYEGEVILKRLAPTDTLVLLDEHGLEFRSVEFANWLEKEQQRSRHLVFAIGGPYGFSDEVYKRAQSKISLSKMTYSHQMVRLVFVEQLYRACTILRGESYHHE